MALFITCPALPTHFFLDELQNSCQDLPSPLPLGSGLRVQWFRVNLGRFHTSALLLLTPRRIYLPRTPCGKLGSNTEPESSSHCLPGASQTQRISGRSSRLTASPPLWESSWYPIQPVGWRPVGWRPAHPMRCAAISSFASLLTNQNSWSWPIRTVLFGPIKLYKLGFLIYLKINQSGTGAETSLYKPASPLSHRSTMAAFPGLQTELQQELFHSIKSFL